MSVGRERRGEELRTPGRQVFHDELDSRRTNRTDEQRNQLMPSLATLSRLPSLLPLNKAPSKKASTHKSQSPHSSPVQERVPLLLEPQHFRPFDTERFGEGSEEVESYGLAEEGEGYDVMEEEDYVLF